MKRSIIIASVVAIVVAISLLYTCRHDVNSNMSRLLFSSAESHLQEKLESGQEINISHIGIDSLFNKGSYRYAYLINDRGAEVALPAEIGDCTMKLYSDKYFTTKDLDQHSILVAESFVTSITEQKSLLLNITPKERLSDGCQRYSVSLRRE